MLLFDDHGREKEAVTETTIHKQGSMLICPLQELLAVTDVEI